MEDVRQVFPEGLFKAVGAGVSQRMGKDTWRGLDLYQELRLAARVVEVLCFLR